MIPEQRMKALRFQADHYGLTESVATRLLREKVKLETQDGMMVMITVGELNEFLSHYPEENEDGSAVAQSS